MSIGRYAILSAALLAPVSPDISAGLAQQAPVSSAIPAPAGKQALQAPDRPQILSLAGFNHFADEDARLKEGQAPAPRAVLMGDSITEAWKRTDPSLFDDGRLLDRGISGQTTPQMLLRFRADVISHHPQAVVILAGTNDLAENNGPEPVEVIEGNLQSMAEIARASHIAVVLCSILPADHYNWHPGIAPAHDIEAINVWLQHYAAKEGFVYVDYFSALAGPGRTMSKDMSADGVHPTQTGFAIMRPLLEKGIAEALRRTHR